MFPLSSQILPRFSYWREYFFYRHLQSSSIFRNIRRRTKHVTTNIWLYLFFREIAVTIHIRAPEPFFSSFILARRFKSRRWSHITSSSKPARSCPASALQRFSRLKSWASYIWKRNFIHLLNSNIACFSSLIDVLLLIGYLPPLWLTDFPYHYEIATLLSLSTDNFIT